MSGMETIDDTKPEDDQLEEELDEDEDEPEQEKTKPSMRYPRDKPRNLTHEAIITKMKAKAIAEVEKIPEDETVEAALPKLDKQGKQQRDANGYLIIEKRTVLKRDKVQQDWAKKIAQYADQLETPERK